MKSFLFPKINPPSFTWVRPESGVVSKVHEWIQPITNESDPEKSKTTDFVVVGVPLSRSSISASGASEFPDFFRRAWKGFSTYNLDEDIDLSDRTALDVGDVPMHVTDIKNAMIISSRHLRPFITISKHLRFARLEETIQLRQ